MPAAVKDSGTGRQTPCAKASASLGRVRRGRERPTLGELSAGASPAVGSRAARKGIGFSVFNIFNRYFVENVEIDGKIAVYTGQPS